MNAAEAQSRLQRLQPLLRDSLVGAHQDYLQHYSPHLRAIHTRRTKRNIVRDHAWTRIVRGIAEIPSVRVVRHRGLEVVEVGDLLLRVKYLKRGTLRASSYPTPQSRSFEGQGVIEGMPMATHADLGYVLDLAELDVDRVVVVCRNPWGIEWTLDLLHPAAEAAPAVAPAPLPNLPHRIRTEASHRSRRNG